MNRKIVHYVIVHFFTRFEIYYFLSPIVASCSRIGRYFFNKTADGRPLQPELTLQTLCFHYSTILYYEAIRTDSKACTPFDWWRLYSGLKSGLDALRDIRGQKRRKKSPLTMPSWLLDWKQKCGNSSLKGTMMTFLWVFFYQILCFCMTMCIEYLFQMAFTTHFVYTQVQLKSNVDF